MFDGVCAVGVISNKCSDGNVSFDKQAMERENIGDLNLSCIKTSLVYIFYRNCSFSVCLLLMRILLCM